MPDTEKGCFDIRLPIAKLDASKGLITGWAALSTDDEGRAIVDHQDEYAPLSELQKAAHGLMLQGGQDKAGEMHEGRVGDIVESMTFDGEKSKALGLGDGTVEGWAVTMKLRDPAAIERVKNGERSELSIHGAARKTPIGKRADGTIVKALSDLTVDEISIVDQGASGNDNSQPRIVIAKRRTDKPGWAERFAKLFSKQEPTMPLEEILALLPDDQRNVVLAAIEAAKTPAAPMAPAPVVPVEPIALQADEKKEEEEMAKALAAMPELVRKRFEAERAVAKADKDEREELKKRVGKMEDDQESAKFVAMAKKLPFLTGNSTNEIAKMLRSGSKNLSKAEFETVTKVFDGANSAVKAAGIFNDEGSPFHGNDDSPTGKLESVAKSLQAKDPELSDSAARLKAADANPDLYDQAQSE